MRAKKERTLVCVKVIKLKNIPRKEREVSPSSSLPPFKNQFPP